MGVVKVLTSPKRTGAKATGSSSQTKEQAFAKIATEFDTVSDFTDAGLETIVEELQLSAKDNLVQLAGSDVAIYAAYHTNVGHSASIEVNEEKFEYLHDWQQKLNKIFPKSFTLHPGAYDLSVVKDLHKIMASASIIFCNTSSAGLDNTTLLLSNLAENIDEEAILVLTTNPWPRPSKTRPAPFSLYKTHEADDGIKSAQRKLKLFFFQHVNGSRPSELPSETPISSANRYRRLSDYIVPSPASAQTPTSSKKKVQAASTGKKAQVAAAPKSRVKPLVYHQDEEDLPVAKGRSKRKRVEIDDSDSDFSAIHDEASYVSEDDSDFNPKPKKQAKLAGATTILKSPLKPAKHANPKSPAKAAAAPVVKPSPAPKHAPKPAENTPSKHIAKAPAKATPAKATPSKHADEMPPAKKSPAKPETAPLRSHPKTVKSPPKVHKKPAESDMDVDEPVEKKVVAKKPAFNSPPQAKKPSANGPSKSGVPNGSPKRKITIPRPKKSVPEPESPDSSVVESTNASMDVSEPVEAVEAVEAPASRGFFGRMWNWMSWSATPAQSD